MTTKKEKELRIVEHVRTLCDFFPAGRLQADEEPDVILSCDGLRLGIEVTQLHELPAKGEFPRRAVESFHTEVVARAEQIYRASGSPPLDVLMYFGDDPLRDVEQTAEALVHFVRTHPPLNGCETFSQGAYEGLSVVRILVPPPGDEWRWRCVEGGSAPILTHTFLADVVAKKNRRLPTYRRKADHVWLLMLSPIAPFSSSFAIPRDVDDWQFTSDFDKVLLWAWDKGVIEFRRGTPRLVAAAG